MEGSCRKGDWRLLMGGSWLEREEEEGGFRKGGGGGRKLDPNFKWGGMDAMEDEESNRFWYPDGLRVGNGCNCIGWNCALLGNEEGDDWEDAGVEEEGEARGVGAEEEDEEEEAGVEWWGTKTP